jgi:hypothetical protein
MWDEIKQRQERLCLTTHVVSPILTDDYKVTKTLLSVTLETK